MLKRQVGLHLPLIFYREVPSMAKKKAKPKKQKKSVFSKGKGTSPEDIQEHLDQLRRLQRSVQEKMNRD